MKELIISLRRHAKTSKSAVEAGEEDIRGLTEEGRMAAYKLGQELRPDLLYCAHNLRGWETAAYVAAGARREDQIFRIEYDPLSEPVITPEFAQKKNVDEQGNKRGRTKRFLYYLNNPDPTGRSTSPKVSAEQACYFIRRVEDIATWQKRVEGITCAPKLECLLHAFDEDAFIERLQGKTFDHLEGVEVVTYGNIYIARFRDQELQLPKSKVEQLANSFKYHMEFDSP